MGGLAARGDSATWWSLALLPSLPSPLSPRKMSACLKFVQRVQAAFVNNGGHDAVTWAHPSNKVSILEGQYELYPLSSGVLSLTIPLLSLSSARPGFVKVQLTLAQHNGRVLNHGLASDQEDLFLSDSRTSSHSQSTGSAQCMEV